MLAWCKYLHAWTHSKCFTITNDISGCMHAWSLPPFRCTRESKSRCGRTVLNYSSNCVVWGAIYHTGHTYTMNIVSVIANSTALCGLKCMHGFTKPHPYTTDLSSSHINTMLAHILSLIQIQVLIKSDVYGWYTMRLVITTNVQHSSPLSTVLMLGESKPQ